MPNKPVRAAAEGMPAEEITRRTILTGLGAAAAASVTLRKAESAGLGDAGGFRTAKEDPMNMIVSHPDRFTALSPRTSQASHPADDLTFMKRRKPRGTGINYWVVEDDGSSYTEECRKGAALGREYLSYLGEHPTYGNASLLGPIVNDMLARSEVQRRGKLTGVEIAFLAKVNEAALTMAAIANRADMPLDADARLVELADEMDRADMDLLAVYDATENDDSAEAAARCDAAYAAVSSIVRQIEETPARSIAGLRAKARAVRWCYGDDDLFDGETTTDMRLAVQIIKWLL
jgi:hypothetical protein